MLVLFVVAVARLVPVAGVIKLDHERRAKEPKADVKSAMVCSPAKVKVKSELPNSNVVGGCVNLEVVIRTDCAVVDTLKVRALHRLTQLMLLS